MSNRLQKRWIFTWNASDDGVLPPVSLIEQKLNMIASEGVFQLEVGETTGRKYYQGRFKLLTRKSKKVLLKDFSNIKLDFSS